MSGALQAGTEGMVVVEEISGVSDQFDGLIDEIWISTVVRPDAWLMATFRNLSAPASFLFASAEETGDDSCMVTRRPVVATVLI